LLEAIFLGDDDYLSSDDMLSDKSEEDKEEDDDDLEGAPLNPNQKASIKRKRDSDFADLEEFSHLLETSGVPENTFNKKRKIEYE